MLLTRLKAGEKTGPVTGQPPPLSAETTSALFGASDKDATGQSQGGQDGPDKEKPQKLKSEKQRTPDPE